MSKEIISSPSEESLQALRDLTPQEAGFTRVMLPRITFKSQDVTEGKGKAMKVIVEAGTFIEERETDDEDEDTGKKIWDKTELGSEIEGIILVPRKQLKYFDESTEEFTSSPVYDEDTEIVPLFCNKVEIARGTPAELKKGYEYVKDGKTKSKLEENRILYILRGEEIFQLNLRGSSMYSFLAYARKTLVPSVVTKMNSESKEKGSIAWNQMTFVPSRVLSQDELNDVISKIREIKQGIADEKAYFGNQAQTTGAPQLTAGKKDEDDY